MGHSGSSLALTSSIVGDVLEFAFLNFGTQSTQQVPDEFGDVSSQPEFTSWTSCVLSFRIAVAAVLVSTPRK